MSPTKEQQERQRLWIADMAQKGAAIKPLGKMCKTCAFKKDSEANLEPHNVDAAIHCLLMGPQFNCHIESGVDKGCECVGYKHAKQYEEKYLNE